jgi:hypothetical protein
VWRGKGSSYGVSDLRMPHALTHPHTFTPAQPPAPSQSVGGLNFINHPAIVDLYGIPNLSYIGTSLVALGCQNFTSFSGLGSSASAAASLAKVRRCGTHSPIHPPSLSLTHSPLYATTHSGALPPTHILSPSCSLYLTPTSHPAPTLQGSGRSDRRKACSAKRQRSHQDRLLPLAAEPPSTHQPRWPRGACSLPLFSSSPSSGLLPPLFPLSMPSPSLLCCLPLLPSSLFFLSLTRTHTHTHS